jgi:hypothetical protein
MPSPYLTESDLRQTAIDEYFASCHKAAVIGGEEPRPRRRFRPGCRHVQVAPDWLNRQEEVLASPALPVHCETRVVVAPRREHVDPDACTLEVQRPASSKIPNGGFRCAVYAEGGRSHRTCSRSREYDGTARPHQRKCLLPPVDRVPLTFTSKTLSNCSSLIAPKDKNRKRVLGRKLPQQAVV